MIRRLATLCAAALTVAMTLTMAPASAVVNGTPDSSNDYPFVGTLIIEVPPDATIPTTEVTYHYWCSGTMISPKVFLTAGHCFEQAFLEELFGVGTTIQGLTFEPNVSGFMAERPARLATGRGDRPIGWPGKHAQLDVGAYVLDEPISIGLLPTLPTVGQLEGLALTGQEATIVGYGMDRDRTGGRNGFSDTTDGIRAYASQRITAVTPSHVQLLGDIAAGGSGPCAGDSGAPRLATVGGRLMVLAISNLAGTYCQTPERALRLDTPTIAAWMHGLLVG